MSTIAIIITALNIEYFFDDLKEYRNDRLLLKGFDYFENKLVLNGANQASQSVIYRHPGCLL